MTLSLGDVSLVWAVTALAAVVQAAMGFGFALIAAAPLLLVHAPLVPGPLLATTIGLTVLMAYRDRAHVDLFGLRFSLLGRAVGTVAAALFMSRASQEVFDAVFGATVLLAVALSVAGFSVAPTRGWAVGAGALSGLMGTISSIGGPPMALLYQSAGAARLRGTLAGFFSVGTVLSVAALVFVGRFGCAEVGLSLLLVPPTILGFVAARPLHRLLSDAWIRPLVLFLSLCSGSFVLLRVLM